MIDFQQEYSRFLVGEQVTTDDLTIETDNHV